MTFPDQPEINALIGRKSPLLGSDENSAVEQRHEAGDDLVVALCAHHSSGGARSPAAVIRLSAMSEILRFWFIAVLRNSA